MVALEPSAPVDRRTPPAEVYQRYYEQLMATAAPDDRVVEENVSLLSGMIAAVHDEVADANKRSDEAHQKADVLLDSLETAATMVDLMSKRIVELERSIEDLMAGSAIGSSEPAVRVRISHAHTLKDGWRCDGTTVEVDGVGKPDRDAIKGHLRDAWAIGLLESIHRNTAPTPDAATTEATGNG